MLQNFLSKFYTFIVNFVQPKVRFALTSALVTVIDYCLYLFLFYYFFPPALSNVVSYSILMILNFFLQRRFVFTLKGKMSHAFLKSISFSIIGLILSTLLIIGLNRWEFFFQYQFITKFLVTGILFLYNFYTKRFAFEGVKT